MCAYEAGCSTIVPQQRDRKQTTCSFGKKDGKLGHVRPFVSRAPPAPHSHITPASNRSHKTAESKALKPGASKPSRRGSRARRGQ